MSMKELYNEGNTTGYSKYFKYCDAAFYQVRDEMDASLVGTYPDPERPHGRQKERRPLRIYEYRDFRITETKNTRYCCFFKLEYIPTGEVIVIDAMWYNLAWFVYWFYRYSGRA